MITRIVRFYLSRLRKGSLELRESSSDHSCPILPFYFSLTITSSDTWPYDFKEFKDVRLFLLFTRSGRYYKNNSFIGKNISVYILDMGFYTGKNFPCYKWIKYAKLNGDKFTGLTENVWLWRLDSYPVIYATLYSQAVKLCFIMYWEIFISAFFEGF